MTASVVVQFRSVLAALLLAAAAASAAEAQQQRPSLNAGRVTAEIAAGTYAGIGGYFVGYYVGHRVADATGVVSDDTRNRVAFTSGVLVAGAVTAGTIYGIGSIGDQTGDFASTYLGTGIGFAAAWGLSRMVLGPQERPKAGMSTAARWAAANLIASLPALGGTVGFNSSRRFR